MQSQIVRVKLKNLRNEVHVGLHQKFAELVDKHGANKLGIAIQYEMYKPKLVTELNVLDMVRKSVLTEPIAKQDQARSNLYRGFADVVKSHINHYDPAKSEAAKRLMLVIDHYGNIATRPVDQKTVAINDMLNEFEAKPQPSAEGEQAPDNGQRWNSDIVTLVLGDWLTQLEGSNAQYYQLLCQRYVEVSRRSPVRMAAARLDSDKILMQIFNFMDALIMVNGVANYEEFIAEWNAFAKRLKDVMAQTSGRRAASAQAQAPKVEPGTEA